MVFSFGEMTMHALRRLYLVMDQLSCSEAGERQKSIAKHSLLSTDSKPTVVTLTD